MNNCGEYLLTQQVGEIIPWAEDTCYVLWLFGLRNSNNFYNTSGQAMFTAPIALKGEVMSFSWHLYGIVIVVHCSLTSVYVEFMTKYIIVLNCIR